VALILPVVAPALDDQARNVASLDVLDDGREAGITSQELTDACPRWASAMNTPIGISAIAESTRRFRRADSLLKWTRS